MIPIGLDRIGRDGMDGIDGQAEAQLDFPSGFPTTAERAVEMVVGGRPDIAPGWIREVWASLCGVGFKDGSGRQVTNWAHYIAGRWPKDGLRWISANGAAEKKEIPAAGQGPSFKTPKWPWRLVALRCLVWSYAPELQWVDLDLESRREIKRMWDALTPERQADLLAEAREGKS